MPIRPFLAMTAAEMQNSSIFPERRAWMACHFSPYGTGLTNLPSSLPPDSLLILNDRTPICGHDPERIAQQLSETVEALNSRGVLLDFQRPNCAQTRELTQFLVTSLSCPVGISDNYAADMDCAVFLPPVSPSMQLEDHLAPWMGRTIWLELALDGEIITLTEQGAEVTALPFPDLDAQGFADEALNCHYRIELADDFARFTLWRTWEDLNTVVKEAELHGIDCCIGLYQELYPRFKPM